MKNKRKKKKLDTSEAWTEEELENYLGFEFIAGFTEGGVPFGIEKNEDDSTNEPLDSDRELPF